MTEKDNYYKMGDLNQFKLCYCCMTTMNTAENNKSISDPLKDYGSPTIYEILQGYTTIKLESHLDPNKYGACGSCTIILTLIFEFTNQCNSVRKNVEEPNSTYEDECTVVPLDIDNEQETKFQVLMADEVSDQTSQFPCDTCGTTYQRFEDFHHHTLLEHTSLRDQNFPSSSEDFSEQSVKDPKASNIVQLLSCPICPKKFKWKISLKEHLRKMHPNESQEQGTDNNASTTMKMVKPGLANPKKTDFICVHCNKSFSKSTNVSIHIRRIHLKQRNYKCDICSKTFFAINDIERHLKVHGVQKKHNCPYCDETFENAESVKVHIENHHKDFISSNYCPYCKEFFSTETAVMKHIDRCPSKKSQIPHVIIKTESN